MSTTHESAEAMERLERRRAMDDKLLQLCVGRGYVPPGCLLQGDLVLYIVQKAEDPCAGCNVERRKCGGRPHR